MWSSASRRLPDSSRLSVETSMLAPLGDLLQRQAPLGAQLAQAPPDAGVDRSSRALVCLHGKQGWHIGADAVTLPRMERTWDCIVVGGGAAGLSAALVLGRARRRTLVVDAGGRATAAAHGIGGLLGHDGRAAGRALRGRAARSSRPTRPSRCAPARSSAASAATAAFVLELADGAREPAPAGAAGHRHGLPPPGAAGHRGALGPLGLPLPVLPRLGGARPAARRARPRRRPACTGRCCCGSGATT